MPSRIIVNDSTGTVVLDRVIDAVGRDAEAWARQASSGDGETYEISRVPKKDRPSSSSPPQKRQNESTDPQPSGQKRKYSRKTLVLPSDVEAVPIGEAMIVLSRSRRSIYNRVRSGRLKSIRLGHRTFILKDSLDRQASQDDIPKP